MIEARIQISRNKNRNCGALYAISTHMGVSILIYNGLTLILLEIFKLFIKNHRPNLKLLVVVVVVVVVGGNTFR